MVGSDMADIKQILSGFSYGELDPRLAARVDFNAYNRGVKTANNVLSIPQGGFTRRFGTTYVATLTATNKDYAKLHAFIYDDKTVYNLLFEHNSINIYLENTLQATVVTTYPAEIVKQLSFCTVRDRLVILHKNFAPAQLVRSSIAANIITGVDAVNDYITITNALTTGRVYPATFTTGGALPVSDAQIYINTTYYVRQITANNIRVYNTPEDAANNENWFNITATGVGNLILENTWTLSNIAFSNLPAYDFDFFPTYSASGFTFTPTGTSGNTVTVNSSGNIFTAAMNKGLFEGNGGILRIEAFNGPTQIVGRTYEAFANTNAIPGKECFLGEPAWSATRGYPSCGTFFQERLFLAGSREIPNGLWGCATSAAYDFDESQQLDDNAISYYPASGQSNYIKAMTSTKSLIVHTNTGNYSTPLTVETALTPSNFSLAEQNKDGVSDVVPVFVDNQIIYVDKSANNVKSMAWDIGQSSYINTNISLVSSHLINSPVDMDVYREPDVTDGYYVICVNSNGQLGIYNSLVEQDVKGWTKANTVQSTTNGYFRDLATGLAKAWVIVERTIGGASVLYLEQLDFNVKTDCSVSYNNAVATTALTGLAHLNGETVQIYADGVVQNDKTVAAGAITTDVAVSEGFVGLKYTSTITPLPVSVQMQTGPTLYDAAKIRRVTVHYYESVGMQIQGYDIPTLDVQDVVLGSVAIPATGIYEYTLMEGWNAFDYSISIIQQYPLPMTLLAIGYNVEV